MQDDSQVEYSFWRKNSLSIVIVTLMITFLFMQAYTGWKEYNKERNEHELASVKFTAYLTTGHFVQATFENWESEFLQMALYVLLTVSLRQKGSSESKKIGEKEEVDREPVPHKNAPWPVKRGGIWLKLYSNSLSLAFIILFLLSFSLHFSGSLINYNEEQAAKNLPPEKWTDYITNSKFWFESFQNWQSEFLAVASIVLLSIWLRQKGSPESKPVDAPYDETGK
jgi:TRAP-type C4-dicarboxylate transport system permease small subunit